MGLTNEHVGPKILAKIKIYVLTRAELLITLCYEIPCSSNFEYNLQKKVTLEYILGSKEQLEIISHNCAGCLAAVRPERTICLQI